MARQRTNFTNAQKAEIFRRDRATCAFSGKSLWILDYGLTPLWDWDWVDHKTPSARGGQSTPSNGVCASYTFNSKKGANTRDKHYFFSKGCPTEAFYDFYGELPTKLADQLDRLGRLVDSDWYFNRCLMNVLYGLHREFDPGMQRQKRTPSYWFAAGWKQLARWNMERRGNKGDGGASFVDRGVLGNADLPDVRLLISLSEPGDERDFHRRVAALREPYLVNCKLFRNFWSAKTPTQMDAALAAAQKSKLCSPLILDAICSHHAYFKAMGSAPSAN